MLDDTGQALPPRAPAPGSPSAGPLPLHASSTPGVARDVPGGRAGRPARGGRMRRRALLGWAAAGGVAAAGGGLAAWSFAWEPALRLRIVRHRVASPAWPAGMKPLTIACVADPHVGAPHTPPERLERCVALTNRLGADMVVLLGDYLADHRFVTSRTDMAQVARILAGLRAPLGVHAILGNHDWWEDPATQGNGAGGPLSTRLPDAAEAFADAGLPVLHNAARRVRHDGTDVWVAGLGSLWAYWRRGGHQGADDLQGTLAGIPAQADQPLILLAHEPDIFPEVPDRVAITLSGHTHGGQVRLGGWSPVVPSRYGNRYAWGQVVEDERPLVVSGGIGNSLMPVRFGMPSEITLVEVGPVAG